MLRNQVKDTHNTTDMSFNKDMNQRATPKGEILNKDDSIFLHDDLDKQRAGSLILPSITDRQNTYNDAPTMP